MILYLISSHPSTYYLSTNYAISMISMDFVVTTEAVTLSKVKAFATDVSQMAFSLDFPLFMPIIQ